LRTEKYIYLPEPEKFKEKLLSWVQHKDVYVWFDSNEDLGKELYGTYGSVLALDAESELTSSYKNAFKTLKDYRNFVKDYVFGYFGYDLKNDIENLQSNNFDGIGFEDLYFFQPKKLFFFKEQGLTLSYLPSCKKEMDKDIVEILKEIPRETFSSNKVHIKQRSSEEKYAVKHDKILTHIHRGDIYEMNFCMEFYAEDALVDPLAVYQKLNRITGSPFATFLKVHDKYLLSGSPERFVKKEGDKVISQPIKGTARRSAIQGEDDLIRNKLLNDPKERSENIMIVDLVRNDLSKTAVKGSVKVEELCGVYTFKQVHQLVSTVVSEVSPETNVVDIIRSLFPMGSMTGAPKISAMEIIEELEETKRGLYSGAVGYFTPDNDFDFNVVIRSILYNATEKYVSFSVGGAITALSKKENEYKECQLKAAAMKMALQNK
jgi:para-aminobenzoate synthetase component 1